MTQDAKLLEAIRNLKSGDVTRVVDGDHTFEAIFIEAADFNEYIGKIIHVFSGGAEVTRGEVLQSVGQKKRFKKVNITMIGNVRAVGL